jgi:predicted amidohydrolase YtcJ
MVAGCGGESDREPADLVLRHGKIVTMDDDLPEVEALASKGETIVAVGSDEEIQSHIGSDTRVIDLEGRLVVPGLIEGHGHFMSFGASLMELDLRHARTWDEIVNMVADAVGEAEPGEWIVGRGWHQDKWERPPTPVVEGLPTHQTLSEVSLENPVLLEHTSGHGVFVNARALQSAGISRETSDPPGGEIVRDDRGEPIGMLRETAAEPAEKALAKYRAQRPPEAIESELRKRVELAAQESIANGITSFQDMGSSFKTIDLLKQLAEEGELPLRLYIAIQEPAEELEDKLAGYRMVNYGNGYLTVRTIGEKVLDGALGTHGGWLLEPYTDLPRSVGFNVTPVEDIRRSAELAAEHDYQMAIQGIGDRAARVLFDIYEETFGKNPEKEDWRWRIEHAQVIHPDDLPRFAELGVIPGIQGIFACSDGPWVIDRLGEERARERGYLFRSMIDSGAVVMNGTDPPVEDIDPIASFHCSVTRELPDGSVFFPEERMTREQALRAYTLGNAYAAFEEDIKGSLTPGKLADITVLSKDILTVPEDEIRDTEIVYTIIGGVVKFTKARAQTDSDE